jgi:succinyl-CoA synthetase alpha subunit
MSVLVNEQTRVVVQGLTGKEGSFHAEQMIAYGTKVVAGVTPGKGGTLHLNVPVFDTVADAVRMAHANVAAIFVPPPFAADAILEAIDAALPLVVCITGRQRAPDRPQLPRHHLSRQVQDRHHARPDSPPRSRRRGQPQRHTHL